jgi:hypothetical protein
VRSRRLRRRTQVPRLSACTLKRRTDLAIWRVVRTAFAVEIVYDDHQRRFSCGRAEPNLPPTMAMEWIVANAVSGDLLVVEGGWVFIVLPDAAA